MKITPFMLSQPTWHPASKGGSLAYFFSNFCFHPQKTLRCIRWNYGFHTQPLTKEAVAFNAARLMDLTKKISAEGGKPEDKVLSRAEVALSLRAIVYWRKNEIKGEDAGYQELNDFIEAAKPYMRGDLTADIEETVMAFLKKIYGTDRDKKYVPGHISLYFAPELHGVLFEGKVHHFSEEEIRFTKLLIKEGKNLTEEDHQFFYETMTKMIDDPDYFLEYLNLIKELPCITPFIFDGTVMTYADLHRHLGLDKDSSLIFHAIQHLTELKDRKNLIAPLQHVKKLRDSFFPLPYDGSKLTGKAKALYEALIQDRNAITKERANRTDSFFKWFYGSNIEPLNQKTLRDNAKRIKGIVKKLKAKEILTKDEVSLALHSILYGVKNKDPELAEFLEAAKPFLRFDPEKPSPEMEKTVLNYINAIYGTYIPDSIRIEKYFSLELYSYKHTEIVNFTAEEVHLFQLLGKKNRSDQEVADLYHLLAGLMGNRSFNHRFLYMRDTLPNTCVFLINGSITTKREIGQDLANTIWDAHELRYLYHTKWDRKIEGFNVSDLAHALELKKDLFSEPVDQSKFTKEAKKLYLALHNQMQDKTYEFETLNRGSLKSAARHLDKLLAKIKENSRLDKEEIILLMRCVHYWADPHNGLHQEDGGFTQLNALVAYLNEKKLLPELNDYALQLIAGYIHFQSMGGLHHYHAPVFDDIFSLFPAESQFLLLPKAASKEEDRLQHLCVEKIKAQKLKGGLILIETFIQFFRKADFSKLDPNLPYEEWSDAQYCQMIDYYHFLSLAKSSEKVHFCSGIFFPQQDLPFYQISVTENEIALLKSFTRKERDALLQKCNAVLSGGPKLTFKEVQFLKLLSRLPIRKNPFRPKLQNLLNRLRKRMDEKISKFKCYFQVSIVNHKNIGGADLLRFISNIVKYGHTSFKVIEENKCHTFGIGDGKEIHDIYGNEHTQFETFDIHPTVALDYYLMDKDKEEFEKTFFANLTKLSNERSFIQAHGPSIMRIFYKYLPAVHFSLNEIPASWKEEEPHFCSEQIYVMIVTALLSTCDELKLEKPKSLTNFGLGRFENLRGLTPSRMRKTLLDKGILTPANLSAMTA